MKNFEMKVELGSLVKDVITGYEGIVTAYTVHLTGCDVAAVKSRELDKDGKAKDPLWIDVTRVEVLQPPPSEIVALMERAGKVVVDKGGPQDECPEFPDR